MQNDPMNTDSAMVIPNPARNYMTPEERTQQARDVIKLMQDHGMTEHGACRAIGLNRSVFRTWAFRANLGADIARAQEALAQDQIAKCEEVLQRLEDGDIDANAARVLVDARKWFASKFLPRVYGEHRVIEHTGNVNLSVSELSEAELLARIDQLESE